MAGEGEVKVLGRLLRPWPHVTVGDTHSKQLTKKAAARTLVRLDKAVARAGSRLLPPATAPGLHCRCERSSAVSHWAQLWGFVFVSSLFMSAPCLMRPTYEFTAIEWSSSLAWECRAPVAEVLSRAVSYLSWPLSFCLVSPG